MQGQPARTWRLDGATACLIWAGASSALIYSGLQQSAPLLGLYERPLRNLNNIPREHWPSAVLALVCAALLLAAYALGAPCAVAAERSRAARLLVLGAPLAFCGLLLLAYPLTSTDIYDYAFRGSILARYGENTFLARPKDFPDDPLLPYVAWKHVVTAYGPLWEGLSLLTARLAGEAPGAPLEPAMPRLLRLLIAYKGLALLSFLLCGAAIWFAAGAAGPARRWQALYLWLWNPLALWETVSAAHNDVWMLLPVVLGLGLLARWPGAPERRVSLRALLPPLLALLLLAAGGLIKFLVLFFAPALLLAALRRTAGWPARIALTALAGALCAGLAAAAYAPFWAGWETLQNVRDRGDLFNASWLTGLRALLLERMPAEEAGRTAALAGLALLAVGVAVSAWRAWRAPERLPAILLGLVLWFLFVCNPWFMPWYAVWALPLAALQPWPSRIWRAVCLFCLLALAYYALDGLALNLFGFDQKSFGREALLAGLIYGPPLLLLARGERAGPLAAAWRLTLCGLGMATILVGFAWRYPLRANAGGLTDIGKLSAYGRDEFVGFVLGVAALYALYLGALRACRQLPPARALPIVLGLGGLMGLAMLGMYPANAIDVFLYAARSRLLTRYGADPNATPLARYPDDAWAGYTTAEWADNTSPYGPLWNLVAAPVTALAGDDMLAAVLGFKLLMLSALLLAAWAAARAVARLGAGPGEPAAAALLLLWNPLVLWEGVGNAHNDAVLALPLLLALWAWAARRDGLVLPLLLAAALIKYATLPLIPLAAVALWRRATGREERLRLAGHSLTLGGLVLLAGCAPFYDLEAMARSVADQSRVALTSPGSTLAIVLDEQYPHQALLSLARWVGAGALALALVALAALLWRRPALLPRACFEALFALLMLATLNLRPWYGIWLVALAAALPAGWPGRRALAFSAGGLALYAFLIWVEAWWKPGPDTIAGAALLIFIGPALMLTLAEPLRALWRRPRRPPPLSAEPAESGPPGLAP